MTISDNQVIVLTGAQLREFASGIVRETIETMQSETADMMTSEPRYAYGIRGICDLFNVSRTTAHEYKNTFLKPAIEQRGRNIRINIEMAEQLFNESKTKQ